MVQYLNLCVREGKNFVCMTSRTIETIASCTGTKPFIQLQENRNYQKPSYFLDWSVFIVVLQGYEHYYVQFWSLFSLFILCFKYILSSRDLKHQKILKSRWPSDKCFSICICSRLLSSLCLCGNSGLLSVPRVIKTQIVTNYFQIWMNGLPSLLDHNNFEKHSRWEWT